MVKTFRGRSSLPECKGLAASSVEHRPLLPGSFGQVMVFRAIFSPSTSLVPPLQSAFNLGRRAMRRALYRVGLWQSALASKCRPVPRILQNSCLTSSFWKKSARSRPKARFAQMANRNQIRVNWSYPENAKRRSFEVSAFEQIVRI